MSHRESRYSNITVVQRVTPAQRVRVKLSNAKWFALRWWAQRLGHMPLQFPEWQLIPTQNSAMLPIWVLSKH